MIKYGAITDIIYNPDMFNRKHKTIYIDIWHDKYSERNVLGGLKSCPHLKIDENSYCDTCGAYCGFIGAETNPELYYKHIYMFVNALKANEIIIKSPQYYPSGFIPRLFGRDFISLKYPYMKTYIIYNKVSSMFSRNKITQNISYYLHFTKSKSKLWKSEIFLEKDFNIQNLFFDRTVLYVNPREQDLKIFKYSDFLICNRKVREIYKKGGLFYHQ